MTFGSAMSSRKRRRRLAMGLETVLSLRKRGFFVPYRHAADMRAPASYPALELLFRDAAGGFASRLGEIESLAPDIEARLAGDASLCLDQGWFPRLDALAAYALVRARRPARIVEVGSGHSTRFMAAAIGDGGLGTRLTCIDPAPRTSLSGLDVVWRPCLLQQAPAADLQALVSGDVLFVDSSHLLLPGTDVDHLIGQILPGLAPGVLLHLHDIFLPDAYPEAWAWRGYNEQSAIAALLQGSGYAPLFAAAMSPPGWPIAWTGRRCWHPVG